MRSGWIYGLGVGLCAALAGACVLGWRLIRVERTLADQPPGVNAAAIRRLISTPLPDSSGREILLRSLRAKYLVLFLFSPQDCFGCLPELSDLNQIASQRHDTRVVGLFSMADRSEATQTIDNFGLRFPLLLDTAGAMPRALAPPKTPWKVVVLLPEGNIVYEDPPSATPAERTAFLERINELAP